MASMLWTFKIHHWKCDVYNTAAEQLHWHRSNNKTLSSEKHANGIVWSEYFLIGCLARNRRANLFAAVSLRSTVPFDQSSSATSSQTTETSFLFVNSLINYFAPWPFLDAKL